MHANKSAPDDRISSSAAATNSSQTASSSVAANVVASGAGRRAPENRFTAPPGQLPQITLPPQNFRHSLMLATSSDSYGTDDQPLLLRMPSTRAHKFVIIPSTPTSTPTPTPCSAHSTTATGSARLSARNERVAPVTLFHEQGSMRVTAPLCAANEALSSSQVNRQPNGWAATSAAAPSVTCTLSSCQTSECDTRASIFPLSSFTAASRYTSPDSHSSPLFPEAMDDTHQISCQPPTNRANAMSSASVRGLKPYDGNDSYGLPSAQCEDCGAAAAYAENANSPILSDVTSVRSLTSMGIGSTDGHKLIIRRVPHTRHELLNLVPPGPQPLTGHDEEDEDSFVDSLRWPGDMKPRPQRWSSKAQFVLACIGYSVGLGNVWRFPYMCYKSGGGVFLLPYCIILVICSVPLLFMELSIGQYTGRGPIGALGQLCPLFKGAGLASVVVSFLMSTYYSVIIAYSLYYFFTSLRTQLPWVDCNNRWNTPDCWVPQRKGVNISAPISSRTPSEEFFERKVLQISSGIETMGSIRWELFACLVFAWLLVYFATWKSIKSSAKVRYFTSTFPFILIVILTCRAVTLEGADEGLRYFFRPNWSELKNANVWINAASQNFNSMGITFGSMISFASYNKYNNNVMRDTISVSLVNIATSLLVGVFAFATLGNLAMEQNTNVRDVIGDGPGLIFIVYPQAMAKMPHAQLWAVVFFFMLLCLGLNSQFAIVEVIVSSIRDAYPGWIKRHLTHHEVVVFIICTISLCFGLPNIFQGGIYFFQLMDHYSTAISIMFLAFCQMIAIAWFYGIGRLSKYIRQMTGKTPSFYFHSCWTLMGPCLLFAIWVLSLINYRAPTYHNGRYEYPIWAYGLGWTFSTLSIICIPFYMSVVVIRSPGRNLCERIHNSIRPNIYECKICGEDHYEYSHEEQEQNIITRKTSTEDNTSENCK